MHDGPQTGVGGEDTVEAGEVRALERHEGHQTLHQGLGRQREGWPSFRLTEVAAVVEERVGLISHRPAGAVPRRRRNSTLSKPCTTESKCFSLGIDMWW